MSEGRLCVMCFKSFVKNSPGTYKRTCSSICNEKMKQLIKDKKYSTKKCFGKCQSFMDVECVFCDGSIHYKRVCKRCRRGDFIHQSEANIAKIMLNKNKYLENRYGDSFYSSYNWLKVRYKALKFYGCQCMCCGSKEGTMHVDHIKPRSLYPELELELNNLQILCKDCNLGKSNSDCTDFRSKP